MGWGGNLRKNEDNQLKATGQSFYKSLSNVNYMHRQKNVKEREMNATIYIPTPSDNQQKEKFSGGKKNPPYNSFLLKLQNRKDQIKQQSHQNHILGFSGIHNQGSPRTWSHLKTKIFLCHYHAVLITMAM